MWQLATVLGVPTNLPVFRFMFMGSTYHFMVCGLILGALKG